MKKTRKKSKKKQYFSLEVQDAIIKYNLLSDTQIGEKNKLYSTVIYPAFDKLAENLINKYKFYYYGLGGSYEECKHNTVSFLTEKLGKYTENKGKAFSYFTIVAKHYLILTNTRSYKDLQNRGDVTLIDEERNLGEEVYRDSYTENLSDFIDKWVATVDQELYSRFSNDKDRSIADSVLEIFKTRKRLDSFHKKTLYVLIRERTGFKTQNITKVVNILKEDFYESYRIFLNRS